MMWQRILRIFFLVLGLVVLYISISRASLEMLIEDEKSNRLRKVPFESQIMNDEEEIERMVHKMPESRTLPCSPFYGVKKMRDFLWISFSKNDMERIKLLLVIADKQMNEVLLMEEKGIDEELLTETMIEAANKLKLASEYLDKISDKNLEKERIKRQINQSRNVYKEIVEKIEIKEERQEEVLKCLD